MKSPRQPRSSKKRTLKGAGSPTNRRKRRSRSPPRRNDDQEPTQRKMLVARRTQPTPASSGAFPLLPRTPQQAAEHKRRMSGNTLADEQKLRQITSKSVIDDEAMFSYPPDMQNAFMPLNETGGDSYNLAYQAWYGGRRHRRNNKW